MKAMILAAGFGRRMLPLTANTPKPLLKVGGKSLIVHAIERLKAAGVDDIVINVSHLGEQITAALGDGSQWGVSIKYSCEDVPLETAGAINHALPLLGESPFLLVNGDIWTDFPLASIVGKSLDGLAHLVLVNNPSHNPQGDFTLNQRGAVIERSEECVSNPLAAAQYNAGAFTYSGIAVIDPQLVERYPKRRSVMPLIEPLRWAMGNAQVSGEYHGGQWLDIGTPERLSALDESLTDSA